MKYTEQDLKDEYEQAVKRKGELYAKGYVEGLEDGQNQALTIPVVSNCDLCNGTGYISVDNMVVECHSC